MFRGVVLVHGGSTNQRIQTQALLVIINGMISYSDRLYKHNSLFIQLIKLISMTYTDSRNPNHIILGKTNTSSEHDYDNVGCFKGTSPST